VTVDQELPQVPVEVRERLHDRLQSRGVPREALALPVHLDLVRDELTELVMG
jgi:hypothetical protein